MTQQFELPILQDGNAKKDHTMPDEQKPLPRLPGSVEGKIWVAPNFNAPLPNEILDAFEGNAPDNTRVIW